MKFAVFALGQCASVEKRWGIGAMARRQINIHFSIALQIVLSLVFFKGIQSQHVGADANHPTLRYEEFPLVRAALAGNVEETKLLLEAGADPNPPTDWVALIVYVYRERCMYTSGYGNMNSRVAREITKLLLDAGADPNTDFFGIPLLHLYVDLNEGEIVTDCLDAGANINERTNETDYNNHALGFTPLLVASSAIRLLDYARGECNAEMIPILCERGAEVNGADLKGKTPLTWAIAGHCVDVVEQLLKCGASLKQAKLHVGELSDEFQQGMKDPDIINVMNRFNVTDIVQPTLEPRPSTPQLRLVNGYYDGITFSGRVEVRQPDGYWGTVCDNYFDHRDAKVICRMLGYENATAKSEGYYGEGTGKIWMDLLQCNGNENSIFDCDYEGWGRHDCRHWEDAGVECEDIIQPTLEPRPRTTELGTTVKPTLEPRPSPEECLVSRDAKFLEGLVRAELMVVKMTHSRELQTFLLNKTTELRNSMNAAQRLFEIMATDEDGIGGRLASSADQWSPVRHLFEAVDNLQQINATHSKILLHDSHHEINNLLERMHWAGSHQLKRGLILILESALRRCRQIVENGCKENPTAPPTSYPWETTWNPWETTWNP